MSAAATKKRAKVFWRCACGHPIYDHGRIRPSGVPHYVYMACREHDCLCSQYRAEDGSGWPPPA